MALLFRIQALKYEAGQTTTNRQKNIHKIITDAFLLTCVSSFVNFQVLRSGEHFVAAREGAGEGLLPRVHSDVVD